MGNIAHICTLLWLDCHVMWELIIPLHAYFMLSSVARKIQNLCRSKPIVWRSKRWSCEVLCSDSLAKVVEVNQGQSRLQGCFVNTRQTETYFHAKWSMTSWNVISEVHHVHYLSILRATLLWLCSSVRVSSECLFITKFWKRTERRRSRRWDVTFQIQGLNVETRVGTYQWQLNAK